MEDSLVVEIQVDALRLRELARQRQSVTKELERLTGWKIKAANGVRVQIDKGIWETRVHATAELPLPPYR